MDAIWLLIARNCLQLHLSGRTFTRTYNSGALLSTWEAYDHLIHVKQLRIILSHAMRNKTTSRRTPLIAM
jgi:hypothetical protein